MKFDPDTLVDQVRALAAAARSAEGHWRPAVDEDGNDTGPDDERGVLVFLNGHVHQGDTKGRQGGGWGVRLGFFDHDKRCWRTGMRERFVTHWMDLPPPPPRPEEAA